MIDILCSILFIALFIVGVGITVLIICSLGLPFGEVASWFCKVTKFDYQAYWNWVNRVFGPKEP